MKKLIALIMAVGMMLAVASCGEDADDTSSAPGSEPEVSTPPVIDVSSTDDTGIENLPPVQVKTDLALTATAFCDDNKNHYDANNGGDYAASCVNDQDITTAWQKDGNVNAGQDGTWEKDALYGEDGEIFIGLEWEEAQYIDNIYTFYDSGNMMETYENGGYTVEYADGDEWIEVENLSEERQSGEITITFDGVTTTKIRINLFKGVSGGKNSPKLFQMSVYESEAAEDGETETEETPDESVETEEPAEE